MIDKQEVRLRCIEAAARFPTAHPEGPAAGVLELAGKWAEWVFEEQKYGGPYAPYAPAAAAQVLGAVLAEHNARPKLGLPEKKK